MIKYRVWDNKQNKYIDSDDVSISGDGILTVVGIEGKYHMSVQPPNDLAPRFIIEQYTGLEDKNGVEICEGDTVAFKHGEAPHALRGEVLAIKGDEVVIGRSMLIGHETYILSVSDIYWIGRDEEADESEDGESDAEA